ncbi:MAG: Holliday junction branch migration DNA helicase RuvB [Candidatus Glassbacteria bacterium]
MKKKVTDPTPSEDERDLDLSLRPRSFDEFIGQERVKANLEVFIEAAKKRGEVLDHCLFYGPPGLGKTTLAHLLSRELGVDIRMSSGPVLERAGDLAGILTNLKQGDILFIDEVHRLSRTVEEYLYPAMEDFTLDILIDRGPHARSVKLNLNRFTLVGATTRAGLLTSPLRARFGVVARLSYYNQDDLVKVVKRSANILGIEIDGQGAVEIAVRARGTPRVANRLLKRIRDYAQVKANGIIDMDVAKMALKMLEVDEEGLDGMDRRILRTLVEKFDGGPVGINTLAVAVGEEGDTIEEVYEPFLIQRGFLQRTPRGRRVTRKVYEHLGIMKKRPVQEDLFGGEF